MTMITDTAALAAACKRLAGKSFVTVDTEFLRDKTYYPQLCLLQLAGPGIDPVAVDPLAPGLDLSGVFDLFADERVTKVFHAARQDLEIFYNMAGVLPRPIFDTQVAAMVCGFGDQIGYNNIVADICKVRLDKGAQFTDWARRPLTDRQLTYALDDVTYLRDVYIHLVRMLEQQQRVAWGGEEMAVLTDPATYRNAPEDAWERIKIRTHQPRTMAVLREVAAWREREAQRRDIPRGRVLRDETLAEIAIHPPKSAADLKAVRGIPGEIAGGRYAEQVLDAVRKGLAMPKEDIPRAEHKERFPPELTPTLEMLKMLLRIQASEHGVAAKLIATGDDLELLAISRQADIPAMKGWRFDVFGREALRLLDGKLALALRNGQIARIDFPAG